MSRNILILGTTNSARSIMAQAYINHIAGRDWVAYSAGSRATGVINPHAMAALAEAGIPNLAELRSQSWREFVAADAPVMDVVVTVCDEAANENEPDWPGCPRQLHWMLPDPEAHALTAEERAATFRAVFALVKARIDDFLSEEPAHRAWSERRIAAGSRARR